VVFIGNGEWGTGNAGVVAVGERDLEDAELLMQLDFGGPQHALVESCHESS
jgi:hypothetical protein